MKNIRVALFSTLILVFVAGCGGASAGLAGTYHLDKAASRVSKMGADAAAARAMLESMDCTIELKADGTATQRIKLDKMDESVTGTWKLDDNNDNKLSITLTRKDGKVDTQTGDYADGVFTIEQGAALMMFKMTYRRR